jgi:Secretion system C-terminal sorting domain
MKRFLGGLLTVCALNLPFALSAQSNPCGTATEDFKILVQQLEQNKETFKRGLVASRGAITYVPVNFWLVAKSNGTGRVSEAKVLEMLCAMNKRYLDMDIQFYLSNGNFFYLNNDVIYDTPAGTNGTNFISNEIYVKNNGSRHNALNIFLTNNANNESNIGVTVLGYYTNRTLSNEPAYYNDWVVIIKSQVSAARAATVEHEVGHFFSLLHPFYGWDNPVTYNPNGTINTDYRTSNACVSAVAPDGVNQTERVSRGADKNCDVAGDRLCDTPADVNLGLGWNNNCNYNGPAKDPLCVSYDPDETNMMGYFDNCESTFSPMQKAMVRADLLTNSKRAYLRPNLTPQLTPITTLPTIIAPVNGATTAFSNVVRLDWSDVPGATAYVVEVSKFNNFSADIAKRVVVFKSQFDLWEQTVPNFLISGQTLTIYWRVTPFGNLDVCSSATTTSNFTTSSAVGVHEIEHVSEFVVSPNPVATGQSLDIHLYTAESFDAQVKIYNMTGQLLQNQPIHFEIGPNSHPMHVGNWGKGIYLLTIESEKGVLNKKIVLNE